MLFHSYPFLFAFLPAVLIGLAVVAARRPAWSGRLFLLLASLFFYGWWKWSFVPLLVASALFNFCCCAALWRGREQGWPASRRRAVVGLAVAADLAVLGYFKYTRFFAETLGALFGGGWQVAPIDLPLAISFFTFQQIGYLVDAARGEARRTALLDYVLSVAFFPQLIAGPIVRFRELVPQLSSGALAVRAGDLSVGLFTFAVGLFKKVVVADPLGRIADPIFDQAAAVPFADAWAAGLAFTLQIYFDFSGYSDMAIGLGRMVGVRLPENFDSPYKATSISEFWRRWHMTLSTFLRDYLYIPLGGNRRGAARRGFNVMATMLLGGLWHGANWTFVVWGGLHGLYLLIHRAWQRRGFALPRPLAWALTFAAVVLGLVVFRADSLERALLLLGCMSGFDGVQSRAGQAIGLQGWLWLLAALALVTCFPNRQEITARPWRSDAAFATAFALLAGMAILKLGDPAPFYYFQF